MTLRWCCFIEALLISLVSKTKFHWKWTIC